MKEGIHFVEMDEESFVKECVDLLKKAQEKGIVMRILGAMAVYIHSGNNARLREIHRMRFGEGVPMFTDLDLMAYSKQMNDIKKFFESLGYKPDRMINILFPGKRLIYYHPEGKYHIDVFFNKLEFSHDVPFGDSPGKGRLELSFPAISPTDVVLEKLQIHHINRKDLVDLIVMFLSHELSDRDGDGLINKKYIAKLLADDWGFWYDARENLEKVKGMASTLVKEGILKEDEAQIVVKKVDELIKAIDEEPKTKNWEKRAKKGTKEKWYREVDEIVR
jgi:polyhydroxyalkanoate synthesis regulator phasin